MTLGKCMTLAAAVTIGISAGAMSLRAEDAAKPAAEVAPVEKPKKMMRLTKPWADLTSLTDEQKQKIAAIHKEVIDQIKAIQEKEKADITALLTDEQKAELTRLEEEAAAKKKMAKEATTKPAKE
jgi:Spy/CpxP family protein refolding chaperone